MDFPSFINVLFELQVTHDITHLTCADVFRAPGAQTPVIVRFSTVIHERGSPETLRDPRGFAVKFYTREGNWDLVGLHISLCLRFLSQLQYVFYTRDYLGLSLKLLASHVVSWICRWGYDSVVAPWVHCGI